MGGGQPIVCLQKSRARHGLRSPGHVRRQPKYTERPEYLVGNFDHGAANSDGDIIQFNGTKNSGMDGANYNPVPSEAVALFVAPHKNWTEGDPLANPVVQVNGDLVQLPGPSVSMLNGAVSVTAEDVTVDEAVGLFGKQGPLLQRRRRREPVRSDRHDDGRGIGVQQRRCGLGLCEGRGIDYEAKVGSTMLHCTMLRPRPPTVKT